jgi:hypothetical protein
MDRHLI